MNPYPFFLLILAAALAILLWPLRRRRVLVLAAAATIAMAALGLYALTGSPGLIPLIAAQEHKLAHIRQGIIEDSRTVKAAPNDLTAWVRLGQNFAEAGQWEASANAFKRAVVLSKGDPRLILAYAKTLVFSKEGKIDDLAKQSFEMVLIQEPENSEARYFLAVYKMQQGDTKKAMQEMKALYRSLPDGSPLKTVIDRQIGR